MSDARPLRHLAGLLFAPLLLACSEQTVEVELHSLQASGEVSFVCRSTETGRGLDRSLCPDFEKGQRSLFGLVTQTSTEEVAVIDTFLAEVVDIEPSAPGYSFLRVPARPGAIATSPGGAATFVAIQGPSGKSGITAIPTTCIGPPKAGETVRDVTTFASCHLPSVPGDITVLVAPPQADGAIRVSCDPLSGVETDGDEPIGATADRECPADLTKEHEDEAGNTVGAVGRRKLAVALPRDHEIVIIDAQWLVDQTPGSFRDCRIEARVPLEVDLTGAAAGQNLDDAPELDPKDCVIQYPPAPTKPSSYLARPAGFAPAGDLLYVGDHNAPVIHVLDVSNPCAPNELPPLLPMSFENPNREVRSSRVAASPLTPEGKRFVYAVDETDDPSSLMAFDVTQGTTNRTPLVRPNSQLVPEPPDRIRLGQPIADVAFALRDLPTTDPDTGIAESGVRCDPNPNSDPNSPGALHRPTSDKSRGAQPRLLRGLFALAMLTSGHVAIVDVDDFDAPCRRPVGTNQTGSVDFRGCSDDTGLPEFLTLARSQGETPGTSPDGAPTVTNEASCNAVEPHRLRSALLNKTNPTDGTGAPSLVAFPEFSRPSETSDLPPPNQPKLLAVPFAPAMDGAVPPPAQVYVGTTLHTTTNTTALLVTDPNVARVPSLTLPFVEPRAVPPADTVSLTYEGAITNQFPNGTIVYDPDDPIDPDMRVEDAAAQYCTSGVYDLDMLGELGSDLGVEDDPAARELFGRTHADVVEITSDLLRLESDYWLSPHALECGINYAECSDTFGATFDGDETNPNRELTILRAYQDRLYVEPKNVSDDETAAREEKRELSAKLKCCFPEGLQYRVHVQKQWVLFGVASGLRSDVSVSSEPLNGETHLRCVRDCDPQKKFYSPRVFEITAKMDNGVTCGTEPGQAPCAVGAWQPGDACFYDPCEGGPLACQRTDASLRLPGPTEPGGPSQAGDLDAISCIHSGITSRFAVYRGLSPSERGMAFRWQTSGGFRSLLTSLAAVSIAVWPQQVDYVPELQRIAIVDGAQLGLTLVSLDSLRVEKPWPVY